MRPEQLGSDKDYHVCQTEDLSAVSLGLSTDLP
jgi:hypothetical protein